LNSALAQNGAVHAFTNHAGRVIAGRLCAISNGVAVIDRRAYPLAIFPEMEIRRMHGLLDVPRPLPPELLARRKSLRDRYLRNEALLKAGAKTPEEAAKHRERLCRAWLRAVDGHDLDEPTRRYARSLQVGNSD
jgi:hypothetical protein